MSIWVPIKIVAGLLVCGVMGVTTWAVWKVREEVIEPKLAEEHFLAMLDETEVKEIEPGDRAFRRALELIALGRVEEGREKLLYVVNFYPGSPAAPESKRILGEMNMDDLLSSEQMVGKSVYKVRPGDSFLRIASRQSMSLDCLMHLNGLMGLDRLHPGDELIVMEQGLRVMIDLRAGTLSLWEEGRFVKEYRLLHADPGAVKAGARTRISSKRGVTESGLLAPATEGYRGARKVLGLGVGGLSIQVMPEQREEAGKGFFLAAPDAEELALVLRNGNEVEILPQSR